MAQAEQPNVLVIHADQHRIDCLGAYGSPDVRSPNLDALAADGVRFGNSFCPFPVCTPSRYSLLSGLYVHEHAGWSNHCTLKPGTPTFANQLRDAGYRTKAVGKMHFTPTYLDLGFDELELSEQNGPGRWDDDYHRYLRDRGLVDGHDLMDQEREYRDKATQEYWDTFGAMVSDLPEEHHSTTWIGDRAVETIEGWQGGGNLLMAGFIKPHHPFDPPAPWHEMYDPNALAVLPGWTDECFEHDLAMSRGYFANADLTLPALRRVMAYYYATISQIDHHAGRMIDLLKRKGLYENTLIIYTADHGDFMGHHHMILKGNNMYDPLAKVPLIVKWPGRARAGTATEALVSNVDVAPTILRRCGIEPPETMHGNDLWADEAGHEVIYCESGRGPRVMVRTHTRKLLLNGGNQRTLLFDLERDPLELEDRYEDADYAADRTELEALANDWRPAELPEVYLDEEAARIEQPNVPALDDGHREKMMEYCAEQGGLRE